jgi:hypothetical protein
MHLALSLSEYVRIDLVDYLYLALMILRVCVIVIWHLLKGL